MMCSGSQASALLKVLLAVVVGALAAAGLSGVEDVRITATTLVALAGTLTGFMFTTLSILIGIADRKFIQRLRLTGHYHVLVSGLLSTAALWMVVIVVGLLAHVVPRSAQGAAVPIAMAFVSLALIQSVVAGYRFSRVVQGLTQP